MAFHVFVAFGLFSALLLKSVLHVLFDLLNCQCNSKAVFSWITQDRMNISLFWSVSIFGWPHTPKMLLGEWAEGRDVALPHLKVKSFIIHLWRWIIWCRVVKGYFPLWWGANDHRILSVYPFSVNCLLNLIGVWGGAEVSQCNGTHLQFNSPKYTKNEGVKPRTFW